MVPSLFSPATGWIRGACAPVPFLLRVYLAAGAAGTSPKATNLAWTAASSRVLASRSARLMALPPRTNLLSISAIASSKLASSCRNSETRSLRVAVPMHFFIFEFTSHQITIFLLDAQFPLAHLCCSHSLDTATDTTDGDTGGAITKSMERRTLARTRPVT